MATKVSAAKFAEFLYQQYKEKAGYILGSYGQNPKNWAKNSWWFTQYDKNGKQKAKALYWREHAKRMFDCQGLSEGYYLDCTGVNIDTKARYNYSQWCSPKGTGLIPTKNRVPGAAVFWGDDNKPGTIHHVGYLYKPVSSSKPEGDWYIIEARGVMYGVVMTKLNNRKPNFWGIMSKYFDYGKTTITVEVPKQEEPKDQNTSIIAGDYINVSHGSYYLREEPNASSKALHVTRTGDKLEYLGLVVNGWYKVKWDGKICYVTSKCGDIVADDSKKAYITIGTGSWNIRIEPNTKSKSLGIAHSGDKLEANGKEENNWIGIKYNGQDAWITVKAVKK